ncbi:LEM3 (ligand-effect modulator 3) family protein /CDC50 family protein [Striga asiatica]|uniref:LEM3 (Ligand-effect modulator 3) family protein /CDC50 family protein n=1 Tax=Striga asiatica TaxID=4170 RepID=A0A5A7QY99_STRAF|nr:LEM3 (ligand-effect modulator 3) family protein /CDC50 family protein [Striga asiatica]
MAPDAEARAESGRKAMCPTLLVNSVVKLAVGGARLDPRGPIWHVDREAFVVVAAASGSKVETEAAGADDGRLDVALGDEASEVLGGGVEDRVERGAIAWVECCGERDWGVGVEGLGTSGKNATL